MVNESMGFVHCKQIARDSALTSLLTVQMLRRLDDCLSTPDFFFHMLKL